jgi:hypothetical protein
MALLKVKGRVSVFGAWVDEDFMLTVVGMLGLRDAN